MEKAALKAESLGRAEMAAEIRQEYSAYSDPEQCINTAARVVFDAARDAPVLLCSPGTATFQEDMTRNADRVFYFDEGPRATTKLISKAQKSQATLEAWT